MKASFDDLIKMGEMLGMQPKWYDVFAIPRFSDFHPDMVANIHAEEAALVEIRCQNCGKSFYVVTARPTKSALAEDILHGYVEYGDPPRHNNCIGETMLSWTIRVAEFWQNGKATGYTWRRNKKYEVFLMDAMDQHPNYLDLQAKELERALL